MTCLTPTRPAGLTRAQVQEAHERIKKYIHETPVLTSSTLSRFASRPTLPANASDDANGADRSAAASADAAAACTKPNLPSINLFFKCENMQRIGAFKVRGAFHAMSRLSPEQLQHGVATHSSGAFDTRNS